MDRRLFLQSSAAAAALAPNTLLAQGAPKANFSFVHFTDTHIMKNARADEGVKMAFTAIKKRKPAFCLAGGDLVMDVLETAKPEAKSLFDLYTETVKMLDCPVHSSPGNHDYFGVFEKSGVSPSDPDYGKKMFEDRIGPRYHSFDHKGWHFVCLDSVFIEGRKYIGRIDEAQLDWLNDDLEKNKTKPMVVMTHIPLVTAALQLVPGWRDLGNGIVVDNSAGVVQLFEKYPVKMVLQGHTHINESVNWKGIQFITTGAVSGNWWKGARLGFPEGYAVITVKGEQVSWKFESYGWKA